MKRSLSTSISKVSFLYRRDARARVNYYCNGSIYNNYCFFDNLFIFLFKGLEDVVRGKVRV